MVFWIALLTILIQFSIWSFELKYNPPGRKSLMSSLREPTFDISHVAGQEETI